MNSNSYSRYRNINSIVHKIDPITKLISFLIISITLFLAQDWKPFVIVFVSIILISLIARVKLKSMFNLFLFIIPFYVMMFLVYALVLWDLENASIRVAFMTARLYLFLLIAVIYTSTTKEMEIARSIEWLITPLKFIKVPTYEISMIITLALRFIPVLITDLFMIMKAQTSRGINVINGSLSTKLKGVFTSLLPMFVIAFKRADDLSIAMSVRKYEIGKKRTKYWKNKFGVLEVTTFILIVGLMTTTILFNVGVIV